MIKEKESLEELIKRRWIEWDKRREELINENRKSRNKG